MEPKEMSAETANMDALEVAAIRAMKGPKG